MSTVPVFNPEEYAIVQRLLATQVVQMAGRKLEEGDWTDIYCTARGLPRSGWSNLHIDVIAGALGVEHKAIKVRSRDINENCGTTIMHPAATRSIRIPQAIVDPNEAMRDLLAQYGEVIENRRKHVFATSQLADLSEVQLRIGWLLWQESLRQFLYFEEPMLVPDSNDYEAQWSTKLSGSNRKGSKNLWVYEKATGKKRYSITTEAGAKVQPYFDVPPLSDPNVYVWTVIGESVSDGITRAWVTHGTRTLVERTFGSLNVDELSRQILDASDESGIEYSAIVEYMDSQAAGVPLELTTEAYQALRTTFRGSNDDVAFRALLVHLKVA